MSKGPDLKSLISPCGPVIDAAAAERTREALADAADAGGWRACLDEAWPALQQVFAASPYLARLARTSPERLRSLLDATPDARLAELLAATEAMVSAPPELDEAKVRLRRMKGDLHLLCALTNILNDRTSDGFVFRLDLRLRPDPASTPPVVTAAAALNYYETVGQNWERAAFIKARPGAGDLPRAAAFLKALEPFVWRRSLAYAAIADVHSIKRQIHVHRADERLEAAGANLKLGAGGIREVEFFVQTQQLILGGRDRSLRSPRTLEALQALIGAGHVTAAAALDMASAYERLRGWEHRVQMLEDEQTHVLPSAPEDRLRVAALAGAQRLDAFDAQVSTTLKTVNRRYGELFASDESLSSEHGSLVFTGVDDDPATLETLSRMGFGDPTRVASTIRAWHHGRIPATRSERGRELFTRLAPRLLEAAARTGAPDAAFTRFAAFFSGLSAGVQIQSQFLAQPGLFELIVQVMAFSPKLASTLARRPAALDALLDQRFFAPLDDDSGVPAALAAAAASAGGFEQAMDAVRRIHREQAFRIGVQAISGAAKSDEIGRAYSDLADACLHALAPAALREAV